MGPAASLWCSAASSIQPGEVTTLPVINDLRRNMETSKDSRALKKNLWSIVVPRMFSEILISDTVRITAWCQLTNLLGYLRHLRQRLNMDARWCKCMPLMPKICPCELVPKMVILLPGLPAGEVAKTMPAARFPGHLDWHGYGMWCMPRLRWNMMKRARGLQKHHLTHPYKSCQPLAYLGSCLPGKLWETVHLLRDGSRSIYLALLKAGPCP